MKLSKLLARNSLYDCSIGDKRVVMVASKIWSCVSPDEQEIFGEILMRFGSQYCAQSLRHRETPLDEKTDGSSVG